jgi:hypothetical protein
MNPSPLKPPSTHYGFQGCLPTDGSGFPYKGFWREGCYYESNQALQAKGSPVEDALRFAPGTYWVCERVEERPLCKRDEDLILPGLTGTYVTLLALHPLNQRPVRMGIWPQATIGPGDQFSPVENEMLILALATTGLAL